MAAIVRHVLRNTGQYFILKNDSLLNRSFATSLKLAKNKNTKTKTVPGTRIDSMGESLASRGFLRSNQSYTPSKNVEATIENILKSLNITFSKDYVIPDVKTKCEILSKCFLDLNHSVPNSELHEIKTIQNIIDFYQTPVNTTLPMDKIISSQDLPENLHILNEYHRFHPETDILFKGQTAFPKSSTLVTGLKFKKKYKGHIAKTSWP